MKIYESAVRKPISTILLFVGVMVFGLFSLMNLAVDQYPEIEIPQISVITMYPGANAADIETNITRVLEDNLNTVSNLKKLTSKSQDNVSMITVEFEYGSDLNEGANEIRDVVSRVQSQLPDDIDYPTIFKFSTSMIPVMMLAVTAEESYPALNKILDDKLVNVLNRVDGVGAVSIIGAPEREVQVNVDPAKLEAYNLTVEQLGQIIAAENVNIPSGTIDVGNNTFNIKADGEFKLSDELRKVVVSNAGGRTVKLSDVAQIRDTLEKSTMDERVNGQRGVRVMFQKQSGANTVNIVHEIQSRLPEIQKTLPKDVKMELIFEGSQEITDAIGALSETILYAFIFVVLVVMAFLGRWRATLIICMTIPVSLICSFIYLFATGSTLNIISLSSLSIAIGMVVDDAIVVLENITTHIERGSNPKEAAIYATNEVWLSVIATTLVVVAIYMPIMFYGGMVGTIYKQFAVTMCIALCLSTVNAMTLSPALCALVLRPSKTPRGFFRLFNIGLHWTRSTYLAVGGLLVRRGLLTIVLFALILFGNYYFFNRLPSAFLPTEDKGTLFCEVTLPSGATLPRTEAALKDVSDLIQNHPGIESIMTIPGRSLTAGEGENLGLLIVNLKDWAQRSTPETKITAIQSDILQRCAVLPDASVNAFVPPAIMGLGATGGVTFSLQATGDQTSQDIAQTTNNLLSRIMETGKAIYAFTSFDANTPMLYLDINRAKAEAMNVPINSIFNALQSQLGSYYINDFNKYGKTYKVKIQLSKELRENLNVIDQLHVSSNDGTEIPLSALASLKWTLGPRQVERFNMFPSASINTQSVPSFSSGEMMALLEQLVQKNLSKDYQISWTDMSYQESQNEGKIVSLLMVSLLVAYLFLVAQYESWTMPISVMLSVATATLGAILALKLAGMSLDIYCQLGLLMLIGLTAKTAILMVEFSKLERDNGASIADAALNGMRVRFRSVMMTALSFVIGVFPMVVASGAGAGSRQSIGVTTFWGMLVATILGMMFIPGLYTIFQRAAESVSGFFHRKSSAEVGKTVSE